MKEMFRETDVVKHIQEIQFGVLSTSAIQQASQAQIYINDFYNKGNTLSPIQNGLLDKRLGTSQKGGTCSTCSKDLIECVGHFGYIELERPVFHVGYFNKVVKLLQNICKRCSHALLNPKDKKRLCEQAKKMSTSFIHKKIISKKVNELCKTVKKCPYCGAHNGAVRKVPPFKITHERFRNSKETKELVEFKSEFSGAISFSKDLESMLPENPIEYIQPKDAYSLFTRIPLDHLPLFGMDLQHAHPKDLILWRIPASPNCIRPSVVSDLKGGTNEDDISYLMGNIIYFNNLYKKKSTSSPESSMDTFDLLQLIAAFLINSEINVPLDSAVLKNKNTRSFVQRLKGKQGRFRGNLSAKRVDFTSRTVISPDPNLRIDQVGVPVEVAMMLTYPENVTKHNIKVMRELVKNGPDVHPGAIYIELKSNSGAKKALKYVDRTRLASELKLGDKIERHLMDGDIVLFNRQPSLHKMSIMAHQVKVFPWRTFRFNECVCAPYNADFDGDEMNIHLPQTEEAKAEAFILMNVKSNLVTPRHGALIIGATQDFLTGSYLLTQKDQFFDKAKTMQLVSSIICGKEAMFKIELPPPAIMKPIELWTGKQIFSTILCPFKSKIRSFESKDNPFPLCNLITYKKDYTKGKEFCINEGWIMFRNSELLAGSLDKSVLGSGSKKNLFYVILKDYGKYKAADAMWRVARVSTYYLINKGFSIGLGDVMPGRNLLDKKQHLLNEGYQKCNSKIEELRGGTLPCQPGCTAEESLEQIILKELSTIREKAGKACVEELHKTNAPLIMALSGSKGSFINISQMIACVGQQAIGGKRVPSDFANRSLPHFPMFSKEPATKGFVSNSFFSGITPAEFFFHTMAGREGLVDTAVKTAETGYMQRRLVKCLEDLYIAYDNTVRNSTQDVVEFKYGCDGLDPSELEGENGPIDFERVLYHVRSFLLDPNGEPLSGADVVKLAKEYLKSDPFKVLPDKFQESILTYLESYGKVINDKRDRIVNFFVANKMKVPEACYQIERFTIDQLIKFLNLFLDRYQASIIEPGTAVGALCAQSIGEPGTQMTLKTFHFAGVAAMNITLGVPRILEIINASSNISTPFVTVKLKCDTDAEIARQVKGRIEKTLLGEVCIYIEENYKRNECFLLLKLALETIKLLKLEVDAGTIKYSICTSKLKIKESDVEIHSERYIKIRPTASKSISMYSQMQHLKRHITEVVIKGLPSVSRAVINLNDSDGSQKYELIVEGNNFRDVIGTYGVNGTKCNSNNTCEVFKTLGIAAAKDSIIKEITVTMSTHGLSVDHRHVMLLAAVMTGTGEVLGIQRHGLSKMKKSVLVLASFEQTADHLFDAACYGQNNPITGVSDCIIMGKPMTVGTGVFKLLHKHKKLETMEVNNKLNLVFDHSEFHVPLTNLGRH